MRVSINCVTPKWMLITLKWNKWDVSGYPILGKPQSEPNSIQQLWSVYCWCSIWHSCGFRFASAAMFSTCLCSFCLEDNHVLLGDFLTCSPLRWLMAIREAGQIGVGSSNLQIKDGLLVLKSGMGMNGMMVHSSSTSSFHFRQMHQ